MAMAAIIVARSATPAVWNTSMESPSSSTPSLRSGRRFRARGAGNLAKSPSAAIARNETTPATMATWFRCTMVIGFRPAGFIMKATMNTAMIVISPPIMRMRISPRNCALSSTRMTPTAAKETSSQ